MKDNLVATSTNGCFIMKQRRSLIYIAIIAVLLLLLLWSMLYSPRVQCQCNKQTSEPEEVLLQKTIVPNNSYENYASQRPQVGLTNATKTCKTFQKYQPTIFVITPTYTRAVQKAELTRQCQTFSLVNDIHWIVIEDSDTKTELVDKLLNRCSVNSTLLNRKTSSKLKKKVIGNKPKNRGAMQRNIGLEWLRDQYKPGEIEGVVYFADDDNTYDTRLFDEMRYTKKVSVWPVAFAGGLKHEGPICNNGVVTRFHVSWSPHRKFPMDMAAFAVNLDMFLANPQVELNPYGAVGMLETNLLSMILKSRKELEGKANDCTEVLVWHTETKSPWLHYESKNPSYLEV